MLKQNDHRCRSGRDCSARCGDQPAATIKPNIMCPQCVESIQEMRDKLPAVRDAVRLLVGVKPVMVSESKISSSKTPQTPLNLAAETLSTDIDEVLSRVGNLLIRDLVQRPAEVFPVWSGDIEQRAYFDGVDLASQVRRSYTDGMAFLGLEKKWVRKFSPCWDCKFPCLGGLVGSGTVECSNCGSRKTVEEYDKYCVELVKGNT